MDVFSIGKHKGLFYKPVPLILRVCHLLIQCSGFHFPSYEKRCCKPIPKVTFRKQSVVISSCLLGYQIVSLWNKAGARLLLESQCVLLVLLLNHLMLLWHVSWHQRTLLNWILVSNTCSGSLSWIGQYLLPNVFLVESSWTVYNLFLWVPNAHKKFKPVFLHHNKVEGWGCPWLEELGPVALNNPGFTHFWWELRKLSAQCNYNLFVTLQVGRSAGLVLVSLGQGFIKFNVRMSHLDISLKSRLIQ